MLVLPSRRRARTREPQSSKKTMEASDLFQTELYSSARKREQERENKKPSKKVKALRHHSGHLGTSQDLGCLMAC